ncbi:cytochrome C [Tahibacter soli]|uniref:Cytochrome C n=1 Tax=Tahibacter soli TaxID=2983605 RepID=A0A9X3YKS7_9GAMM|nr:cytochrome C [Tahibacter soli]MDC8014184.1 cytochrome C [Tahibacter soli]
MRSCRMWMLVMGLSFGGGAFAADTPANDAARGRYLATIGGCHDCHTPGYALNGGKAPEAVWLTGDALGWSGAWGTTYPTNLRLRVADMDEKTWLAFARTLRTRPPMPYWVLNEMSDDDLSAIWKMLKTLGKGGAPAPAALPPGVEAKGPVVRFPAPPPSAPVASAAH